MQVSSVNPAPTSNSTDAADPSTSLTSGELFSYCESQIDGIDGEVDGYFNQEEANNQVQTDLNTAMDAVRSLQAEATAAGGSATDPTAVSSITTQLQAIAAEYPAGAAQINDAIGTLTTNGSGGTDGVVSTTDAESIINTLSDVGNQIDSDNQMQMINLQSAMSDREQAIELTSNILQSVDQSAEKVIANIAS